MLCFLFSCKIATIGEEQTTLKNEEFIEPALPEATKQETIESEEIVKPEVPKVIKEDVTENEQDEKRILDFFTDLFKSDDEEKVKAPPKLVEEPNEVTKPTKIVEKEKKVIKEINRKDKVINKKTRKKDSNYFGPDKIKEEKRILDFFTDFFDTEEKPEVNKSETLNVKKEDEIDIYSESDEINANKKQIVDPKQIEIKNIPTDIGESDDLINSQNVSDEVRRESPQEPRIEFEDNQEEISVADTKIFDEKQPNENLAFFDINPLKPKDQLKREPKNNFVGLLLPLTGEKRSAGKLVLDTFRYSLATDPKNIIFKIYDTKGTSAGAIEAARKGKDDDVEVFIGPVFSYETAALKKAFLYDDKVTFFSLSPDTTNVSDNIIISGQNPSDQISCIVNDILGKEIEKVLLIHHNDRYGDIVKESLEESLSNIDSFQRINLSFFTVYPGQNINMDIMKISDFENRKKALKDKRRLINNDESLEKSEKKSQLKKLERQLTLGVPFDSIIIASEGNRLTEILSHLAFYDINSGNTRIYGTSLWEDTNKSDKVFNKTLFASNLKSKNSSFVDNYKDIFAKDPRSVNFHLFDLIDLVNDFKFYENYPNDKIHFGQFTNSRLDSGFLKRETFIKKNKGKNKTENVFNCQLSII